METVETARDVNADAGIAAEGKTYIGEVISTDITMTGKKKCDFSENVLRFPRLDTVLMVERFIRKHSGEYKKRRLWENLPKKTMYQTYCVIIDYLLYSGKIGIDRETTICWIWDPALARKYLARKDLGWEYDTAVVDKVRRRK